MGEMNIKGEFVNQITFMDFGGKIDKLEETGKIAQRELLEESYINWRNRGGGVEFYKL